MLPSVAAADTAADENGTNSNFEVPVTAKTETPTPTATVEKLSSVDLTVYVVNKSNQRFLGDVKLTFSRYPSSSQIVPDSIVQKPYKTTDPPSSSGYKISSVPARQYELVAERKGYKIYDETVDLSSDKKTKEITVEMAPLDGTPEVDESSTSSYLSSLKSTLSSLWGTTSSQLPYSTNSYLYTSNNGATYNPYSNYPNQYSYNTSQYTNGQYTGQNTYNLYANTSYTTPLLINLSQSANLSSENLSVNVLDLSVSSGNYSTYNVLNNQVTLQRVASNAYTASSQAQSLYGCLQPGRSYSISITSSNAFQAYSRTFTSPTDGQGLIINAASLGNGNFNLTASGVASTALQYQCPSTNYQYNNIGNTSGTLGGNGTYTFADSQIDFSNLSNYTVQRTPQNGWYYLVNKNNALDNRLLYFVDRGDGKGGLVFFSATQTAVGQEPPSSGSWYFTGYTRSDNDNISFTPNSFSKTSMSPSAYANIVNKTVAKYFSSQQTQNSGA